MAPSDYNYEYFKITFPAENVAHVEINRPEKLNAFKQPMWTYLGQIFNRLSAEPDVRCIVLSGAGDKAFTAGLDVQDSSQNGFASGKYSQDDTARTAFRLRRHILEYQDAVTPIETCEKPVICVLHGYSYGAAIDISSACDIRVCAEGTKFCVKEIDIGLAADVGTLSRLPKTGVSISWVKDVSYTARVFDPAEALRVGYVSSIFKTRNDAVNGALDLAKMIASKSPVAVQGTKHVIDYSREHSTADGLKYVATWNSVMLQTEDVKKALFSGIKKTSPKFAKL